MNSTFKKIAARVALIVGLTAGVGVIAAIVVVNYDGTDHEHVVNDTVIEMLIQPGD